MPFRVEREATTAVGFVLGEQCYQFTQMIHTDRRCIEVSPRLQHAADLGEGPGTIRHVVEHVVRDDGSEILVWVRDRLRINDGEDELMGAFA